MLDQLLQLQNIDQGRLLFIGGVVLILLGIIVLLLAKKKK